MNETFKKWLRAAMTRAVSTFFHSGAASAFVLFTVKEFSREIVVCTAILAGLLSLLESSLSFPDTEK